MWVHATVTASTMIAQVSGRRKVGCHREGVEMFWRFSHLVVLRRWLAPILQLLSETLPDLLTRSCPRVSARPSVVLVVVAGVLVLRPLPHDFVHIDVLLRIDAEKLYRIFLFHDRVDGTNTSLVQLLKAA
jgi:hypothetical protein